MPIPDIIEQLDQVIYEHPSHTIHVADTLTEFAVGTDGDGNPVYTGGTQIKQLYLLNLKLLAAPEIDSAEMEYDIGEDLPLGENAFRAVGLLPTEVRNKYVRIVIDDTIEPDAGDPKRPIVWYGIIDTMTKTGVSMGKMLVHASGILKLLENDTVMHAVNLKPDGSGPISTDIGRPFNVDDKDTFSPLGNRADSKVSGYQAYWFSNEDRGRTLWTAHTAVEYLLSAHTTIVGTAYWALDPATDAQKPADWYDVQMHTHGKSVKQLLDELIPRKRAMSYWAYYDASVQKMFIKMFTFVASDLTVDPGRAPRKIKANPNQFEASLNSSIWVNSDVSVTESVEARYDTIIGYGERCTTTCTLTLDPDDMQFLPDWSLTEETDFKDAASTTDKDVNNVYRLREFLNRVYSRFKLSDYFNGRATWDGNEFWIDPLLKDDGTPGNPYDPDGNKFGQKMRVRGLRILHHLPFKERFDYSGTNLQGLALQSQAAAVMTVGEGWSENIAPMFWYKNSGKFYPLDALNVATKDKTGTDKHAFSCHLFLPRNEPSVEIKIASGRQTLFAKTDFTTPAATGVYSSDWDPVAKNGIDYQDCLVTVCIELERQVSIVQDVNVLPGTGPRRVLQMDIDNARLDYVVPHTVVAVTDGTPQTTTNGGYVRDDRERLKSIVAATAEWYGRVKRTVQFTYRQVRQIERLAGQCIGIGDLLTSVETIGLSSDINTPVTSIEYSMGSGQGGSTTISTGFAEVDFQ